MCMHSNMHILHASREHMAHPPDASQDGHASFHDHGKRARAQQEQFNATAGYPQPWATPGHGGCRGSRPSGGMVTDVHNLRGCHAHWRRGMGRGSRQLAVQGREQAVGRDDDRPIRQRLAILVQAVQVIARGRRLPDRRART